MPDSGLNVGLVSRRLFATDPRSYQPSELRPRSDVGRGWRRRVPSIPRQCIRRRIRRVPRVSFEVVCAFEADERIDTEELGGPRTRLRGQESIVRSTNPSWPHGQQSPIPTTRRSPVSVSYTGYTVSQTGHFPMPSGDGFTRYHRERPTGRTPSWPRPTSCRVRVPLPPPVDTHRIHSRPVHPSGSPSNRSHRTGRRRRRLSRPNAVHGEGDT